MSEAAADYGSFAIGRRWRLLPPGAPPSTDGRIDLVMARGAFGSGEHETTASCLEALEGLPDVAGTRLLDLGSGTAILAIAALKLGAQSALCLDVDPAALVSAQCNCRLNGVGEKVRHVAADLGQCTESGFDLVLANVYGDLLLRHCPAIAARVRVGGTLLLSGILWEHNWDVRMRYAAAGCDVVANRFLDEYSTVVLRRVR